MFSSPLSDVPAHLNTVPTQFERMRVESAKNAQTVRLSFSESRCFGVMKNQKIKKIYGDPKKLSRFKNAGKPAFSQPKFNAATNHHRKSKL